MLGVLLVGFRIALLALGGRAALIEPLLLLGLLSPLDGLGHVFAADLHFWLKIGVRRRYDCAVRLNVNGWTVAAPIRMS